MKIAFFSKHTPGGIFLSASPDIEKITGYTQVEIIGQDAYSFFFPKDLTRIVKSHLNTKISVQEVSYRFLNKSGQYVWLRAFSYEEGDYIYCYTFKLGIIKIILAKLSILLNRTI